MKSISTKQFLAQLKADLIGKDSYRGVTLTYSWLANQVGHFALGFIPAIFLSEALKKYSSLDNIAIYSALFISIAWLLFETYNFLGPLLKKKGSASKLFFSPPWANIAFDTFTDLCFFWLGAFTASMYLGPSAAAAITLLLLFLILIYPARYWYLTKMYVQAANYPFQFRLSQWEGKMSDGDREVVNQFINGNETGKHLFVFGKKGAGKTSISIGIGSEKSIAHSSCMYTTGIKLYSLFFEPEEQESLKGNQLWTWRKSSLLVIDDINPGDPVKDEIVPPELFLKMLDTYSVSNQENRNNLKNKNVLWVIGDRELNPVLFDQWKEMLVKTGVQKNNISAINLL